MKYLSLFSGIGAFEKALLRLNISYQLIGFSEIDRHAIKSYCAIHGVDPNLNLGDISKIDEKTLPDFDLVTYGFPCQDLSVAGRQTGLINGNGNKTRSGLLFDALRIIKHKKPKYAIAENVKNLVSKKFIKDFEWLLQELESYGYNNYWQVLNAKDFGIPQNRERVFIVSIRKDIDNGNFMFPVPIGCSLKLQHLLEEEVDEKYYIKQEKVELFLKKLLTKEISNINSVIPCCSTDRINKKQNGRRFKINEDIMFTLTAQDIHGVLIKNDSLKIKKDNICSCLDSNYHKGLDNHQTCTGVLKIGELHPSQGYRIYSPEGISRAITATGGGLGSNTGLYFIHGIYRIRRLIPLECWRLMGFEDEDFHKAKKLGLSDRQLYKQAGNSIVVNVLEHIFKNLFSLNTGGNSLLNVG